MTRPAIPLVPSAGSQRELWLALERASDVPTCGGKAASLGQMLRAGLPVPAGIVLTTHALQAYLECDGLRPRIEAIKTELGAKEPGAAGEIEARVRSLFASVPLPDALRASVRRAVLELPDAGPLAVRSSAVGEDGAHSSYAGLLDSVLHVDRTAGLEAAIKHVWASRWSARVSAYARTRGTVLDAMGVIIQVQIDPTLAGVLFTRSPEPGRADEMMCEHCPGLADKLVAGEITPARLAVDRTTLAARPLGQSPGAGDARLDPERIEALATAALACERIFGCAQDIEWALDRDQRLWLVQSRPITTPAPAEKRRRIVWSNANVNENFPAPISPLLYSLAAPGYSHYFRNLGQAFGLAPSRLARMSGDLSAIIGVQAGRMYYNLTAIHSVLREAPLGKHLVAWFDDFTGASDPSAPETGARRSFVRSLRDAFELSRIAIKTTWQYLFIERRVTAFEVRIDQFAVRSEPERLKSLSVVELRDLLRGFMHIRLNRWTDAALADAAAMACYGALKALVARTFPGPAGAQLHNALLKGLSGLKSAEPVTELWALARMVREDTALSELFRNASGAEIAQHLSTDIRHAGFHGAFKRYLDCWGFRCSGELMLTLPSFQERPAALLEIVRAYAFGTELSPQTRLEQQQAERERITKDALGQAARRRWLPFLPWPSHASILRPLIGATQAAIGLRERARLKQALLYGRLRWIALEIGRRLVDAGTLRTRDEVFFLTMPELDQLLSGLAMFPAQTAALVELRRSAHEAYAAETPADVLIAHEGEYPDVRLSEPAQSGDATAVLHGTSVCGGVASGTAKVLTDVAQTRTLCAGDVLVTRQTDPGWAPAFVAIGALVLERGGMLSHGAILAREYGIPTIVGIAGATSRIVTGMNVQVDGDRGDVRVLA
jgi:rifampicin phosphotransferase